MNHRRYGEFTKYAMTTLLPIATAQIISVGFDTQLRNAYRVWIVPIFARSGIFVSEKMEDSLPFVMAVLFLIDMEALSLWWLDVPIQRNHSPFMRNILRTNSYKDFSERLSNLLSRLDEETYWNTEDFIRLNAEVDVICDNKAMSKTRDPLHALQQSPVKNNITLVIGEPGSGRSVAMRGLCTTLLRKCKKTQRIPLYVNLKHWNKNWEGKQYPTQKDLKKFILDSFDQYCMDHF